MRHTLAAMSRRVAAVAVLAIVLALAAGTGVWLARVRAVTDAIAQQAQLARALLAAHPAIDAGLARTIVRPGLRVVLTDFAGQRSIEADGATALTHRLPPEPDDVPPGAAPPGMPPPGARPGGAAPRDVIAAFAGAVAHVRPDRFESGDTAVAIEPDTASLGRWLLADALACMLAVAAIGLGALGRIDAFARAERAALRATSEQRRSAAERYQHLLAETAHELRTPLTVVSGYVDILRSGGVPGLDERIVEGLRAETQRMRTLVAKMLTLARLESPAGVPRLLDAGTAASACVETMRRRYPGRTIAFDAAPSGSIVIDGDDLADALGNVLENALKYAPASEIAVTVSAQAGAVTIAVRDAGPGIRQEELDAIFERFFRGSARENCDGLGLGLAIVRGVAQRWNGSVSVESSPGNTVFGLAFPLADEETHALAR